MNTYKLTSSNGGTHIFTGSATECINDCKNYMPFPKGYDFSGKACELAREGRVELQAGTVHVGIKQV